MAIWQYTFFILPKEILEVNSNLNQFLDDGLFDDAIIWNLYPKKNTELFGLDDILPLGKSWNEDLIVYGDLDSTNVEVLLDNDFVQSISFRIDFRSEYEKILYDVFNFCMKNHLILVDENLNVTNLNNVAVSFLIKKSNQYKTFFNLMEGQEDKGN